MLIEMIETEPGKEVAVCAPFLPPDGGGVRFAAKPASDKCKTVIFREEDGSVAKESWNSDYNYGRRARAETVIQDCDVVATIEGITCTSGTLVPVGPEWIIGPVEGGHVCISKMMDRIATTLGISVVTGSSVPEEIVRAALGVGIGIGSAAARECSTAVKCALASAAAPWWLLMIFADRLPFADLLGLAGRLTPIEAVLVTQHRSGFNLERDGRVDVPSPAFSDDDMTKFLMMLSDFSITRLGNPFLAALRLWRLDGSCEYVVRRRLHSVRGLRCAGRTLPRDGKPCCSGDGSCIHQAGGFDLEGLWAGSSLALGTALQALVALGHQSFPPGDVNCWEAARRRKSVWRKGWIDLDTIVLTPESIELINRVGDFQDESVFDRPHSVLANPGVCVEALEAIKPRGGADAQAQEIALYLATHGEKGKLYIPSHRVAVQLLRAPWISAEMKAQLMYRMAVNHVWGPKDPTDVEPATIPADTQAVREILHLPTGSAALAHWLSNHRLDLRIEGALKELQTVRTIVEKRAKPPVVGNSSRCEEASIWLRWIAEAIERVEKTDKPNAKLTAAAPAATSA